MMNIYAAAQTAAILAQAGTDSGTGDSGSSWDLKSFLDNAGSYGKVVGGSLLSLMGLIGVIWGGVLLVKKLLSEQSRENWIKILALILIGGALMYGGLSLILNFARGGKDTVTKFGNDDSGGDTGSTGAVVHAMAQVPSPPGLSFDAAGAAHYRVAA